MLTLLMWLWGQHGATGAAQITIFASRAMATVLERVGPEFEETTGHTLHVRPGEGPEFAKRIDAGEPFDMVIAPSPVIDDLARRAKIIAGTRTPLVRSRVSVAPFWIEFAAAVHTGAAEPGAARELIQFLARSKAHPVIAMQGMEPA